MRHARLLTLFVIVLLAAGCGTGRYPVTGQVVYEDGTPLNEGTVVAEMEDKEGRVMAQGNIQPDGKFDWGTKRPGDGARPGKYRVAVLPRALGDAHRAQGMKPAVDRKFTSMERSGIAFEVKEGRNELKITVTKPASSDE
jgi:hypothetical protein